MGVSAGFAIRARSGGGKGGSALTLAKKIIEGTRSKLAAEGDGTSINDPYRLQQLIDMENGLYKFAKDEGDKLDINNWIEADKARLESLQKNQTKENISYGLENSIKNFKYNAVNQYADKPIDFLKSVAQGYYALADLGAAEVDNLESVNRLSEANALKTKIKDAQKEVSTFSDVWDAIQAGDQSKLQNYAVVYRTDSQGNVIDMGFRRSSGLSIDTTGNVDDIGNGVVPLSDKDGNDVLLQGVKVFVNKQNIGGLDYVKIGGQTATVGQRQAGYDLSGKAVPADYSFKQTGSPIAKLSVAADDNFYKSFNPTSATPETVDKIGAYAVTADNRTFRFNKDFKWDEISKDALTYFPDYNPMNAVKVPDVDFSKMANNSGNVITKDSLFNNTSQFDQGTPGTGVIKNSKSLDVTPTFTGSGQSMTNNAFVGSPVATNRNQGMVRPSGNQQFQSKVAQMFSGTPAP